MPDPTRARADVTSVTRRHKDTVLPNREIRTMDVEERNHHHGRSPINNFGRGVALEIVNGLMAPAAGSAKLIDEARQHAFGKPFNMHEYEAPIAAQKEKNEEFFQPEETSGRLGRLAGMVAGELPYYIGGTALLKHGVNMLNEAGEAGSIAERAAKLIEVAEKGYGATRKERAVANGMRRAAGQAITSVPTAATLGAAQAPMGHSVVGPAVKSAVAWGASGFAAEPAMNVAAKGVGRLLDAGVPATHVAAGIKSAAANTAQATLPYLHQAVPRIDDYVKYDLGDRLSDVLADIEMKWNEMMGRSRD